MLTLFLSETSRGRFCKPVTVRCKKFESPLKIARLSIGRAAAEQNFIGQYMISKSGGGDSL